MTDPSDSRVSRVSLPNEVRHDVTYNVSENLAIGYRNLSHGVGVISIKNRKTGNLVDRKIAGVRILEDGEEMWETAWLHAGQAVMYQVPDGEGRHHYKSADRWKGSFDAAADGFCRDLIQAIR